MGCHASTEDHVSIDIRKSKASVAASEASSVDTWKAAWTSRSSRNIRIKECYDIHEQLGTGCFAEVRACSSKKSKMPPLLAVKILEMSNEKAEKKARRELEVWRKLGTHEHIVPLMEEYIEGKTCYFIMPRCLYPITEKFKTRRDSMVHNEMLDTFHQVFLGLQHCHSLDVIHRDMKAANILVDFSDVVKIADFGLSISKHAKGTEGLVGSVPYMSPEMVRRERVGVETDIWSCGVSAYTLFYDCYPYEAVSYKSTDERKALILDAILQNHPAPDYKPVNCKPLPSTSVRAFIERLIERNPQARPDALLCSKLSLSVKAGSPFDPENLSDIACENFEKPTFLLEDDAGSSWATTCPTDVTSSGAWSSFGISPMKRQEGSSAEI